MEKVLVTKETNTSNTQDPSLRAKPHINIWKAAFLITLFLWLLSLTVVSIVKVNKLPKTKNINQGEILSPSQTPITITPAAAENGIEEFLPVIVYDQPGYFSPGDKQELNKKIVQPFFDYFNEKNVNYIAMIIEKKPGENYEYSFMAIHKNGGTQGSVIYKQGDNFSYWAPTCMGPCEYTKSYEEKYPEVVKQTNQ